MNDERVFLYGGWNRARRTILEAQARAADQAGPQTLVLLGAAGSGKTMLLRRLAHIITGQGKVVRLVTGDIPADADATDVLLVDCAERLDDAALTAQLAAPTCFCVLAARSDSASRLTGQTAASATVTLNPMRPAEAREFVAVRFARIGQPQPLDDAVVTEIARRSGGVPGRIVELVEAAVGNSTGGGGPDRADPAAAAEAVPEPSLAVEPISVAPPPGGSAVLLPSLAAAATGAEISVMPDSALPGLMSPPEAEDAAPPPRIPPPLPLQPAPRAELMADAVFEDAIWSDLGVKRGFDGDGARPEPQRRRPVLWRAAIAGAVVLASAALLWIGGHEFIARMPVQQDTRRLNEEMLAAGAKTAVRQPRPLPDGRTTPPPDPAEPAATLPGVTPLAGAAAVPPISVADEQPAALTAVALAQSRPRPAPTAGAMAALAAVPPVLVRSTPVPTVVPPAAPVAVGDAPAALRSGTLPTQAPGLVLVARAGDTLPDLYRKVYGGTDAPPYSVLVAANPGQIKPGTTLIFPAPPHGWGSR